jgi:uncharacterized protein with PQ loop repeat
MKKKKKKKTKTKKIMKKKKTVKNYNIPNKLLFKIIFKTLVYVLNMKDSDLKIIPYTATSISVIGRFIFMFLLYKNKSTNSLSLLFCILSIFSSSMWIYYSIQLNDLPMIFRSSIEITLLSISAIYIIRNKTINYRNENQILPQHILPQQILSN